MKVDYLIVGSGLTGSTIARILCDAGLEVVVVERRDHIGGNLYDYTHPSGITIHRYGPHYFRTNSNEIWDFMNCFSEFYEYKAVVKSYVDGRYENWPITNSYIRRVAGETWEPEVKGTPGNFEEYCLSIMPRIVYERFIKRYTEKQWGRSPHKLSVSLSTRVVVSGADNPYLTPHYKHQGLPKGGYTNLIAKMLRGIPVILNFNYLNNNEKIKHKKKLIYTGPIDDFFNFNLGHLVYRGLRWEHTYVPEIDYKFPCGQINNPDLQNGEHIRTLEWKHMMPEQYASHIRGTVLTREVPMRPKNPNDYMYPFPDDINAKLYRQYREQAEVISGLLICGRLGEYQYYDMQDAIQNAIGLAKKILKEC